MRKQTTILAVLSAAAVMAAAAPTMTGFTGVHTAMAASDGWVEEDGSWHYYDEDGYQESNTWKKRGSDWYYLDDDGEIAVNQRIDDYFVDSEGRMVKNRWISADSDETYDTPDSPSVGSWNYFGKDGKITLSKWLTIDNKTYYFDEDGLMVTGLLELNGSAYYLGDENDGARKTGWVLLEEITQDTDDEEIWSYFDEDGKMVVNQMDRRIDNKYYTFIDGKMQTGWVNVAEAGFIAPAKPAAEGETQTVSLNDFRYYDKENGGSRASGWLTIEGAPGFSDPDEEYTFYFKNGEPYFGENGIEIFTINSKRYAFNENGEMQTGKQTITDKNGNSANYYFDENGVMQTGKQTIYDEDLEENQTWYFSTSGSSKGQGFHGERDNQVYVYGLLKKADPELRYEPVTIGEKTYLVNTSGKIQQASASSTSSSRPELGKGFKDIKDANDTIWTVDSSGIIQ